MVKASALAVENLHKSFANVEVLKGIQLEAFEGDVISVLGASGSGKSTLLRCINLLETADSGQVSVHGETIHMKKNRHGQLVPTDMKQVIRLRTKLGMVFQNFNLWAHMTVLQNVTEPLIHVLKISKSEALMRAEAMLEKVGLYDRKAYYPSHISGGQQQRAAIARALAMEPTVMLFDEPTSALDPELVGEVLKVIGNLVAEGATMLMVTHELGFARDISSRVVFLHEGRVEVEGIPQSIFNDPESVRFQQFLCKEYKNVY